MSERDLVFRARRVITPAGERSACVSVRDGSIVSIDSYDAESAAARLVRLSDDEVLLPGLVDTHVHVNDPGRSDWEEFGTATRAAAAGGITTIIDMPLNSIPPTTDTESLAVKRKTASGQAFVDVGFWGGAVPGNLAELRGLHEAGVYGFKCFLLHSGVDEFPHLSRSELRDALRETGSLDALMIVHAEDAATIDHAPAPSGRSYRDFLASRPREAENRAIAAVIDLARSTGCRVHLLHLSSSDALALIRSARRDGVRLTVETCPHYLTFSAGEIADGATQFKCCPPIREASNRELLWSALADGTIDCVVSDHSPSTASLKQLDTGDFGTAWGGIASLQVGLPVVWSEARARGFELSDVVRWMGSGPARIAGLQGRGDIAVGSSADLCVFAPDESFVVDARRLHHKNPVTPYDGRSLTGVVRGTWLRGVLIDDEPRGRLLTRGAA